MDGHSDFAASQIARLEAGGPLARGLPPALTYRRGPRRLSLSEDVWVRKGVAQNPAAPRAILEQLAADVEEQVRELVAANPVWPATPPSIG